MFQGRQVQVISRYLKRYLPILSADVQSGKLPDIAGE